MTKHNLPMWRIDNLVSFIVTIIGGVFTILTMYFAITSDIRSIKQDLAYIKDQNEKMLQRYVSLKDSYGDLALQVQSLQTTENLRYGQ